MTVLRSSRSLLRASMDNIEDTAILSSKVTYHHKNYIPVPIQTREKRAYDDITEEIGYNEMIKALTRQEIDDMCDNNLPLRHFRGEIEFIYSL